MLRFQSSRHHLPRLLYRRMLVPTSIIPRHASKLGLDPSCGLLDQRTVVVSHTHLTRARGPYMQCSSTKSDMLRGHGGGYGGDWIRRSSQSVDPFDGGRCPGRCERRTRSHTGQGNDESLAGAVPSVSASRAAIGKHITLGKATTLVVPSRSYIPDQLSMHPDIALHLANSRPTCSVRLSRSYLQFSGSPFPVALCLNTLPDSISQKNLEHVSRNFGDSCRYSESFWLLNKQARHITALPERFLGKRGYIISTHDRLAISPHILDAASVAKSRTTAVEAIPNGSIVRDKT